MDFYEALNYRGWVKSFLMDDLDPNLISKIKHYVKCLKGIHSEYKNRFEIVHHSEIKKKHNSLFSERAPYYFIIYMNDLEKELMNAGYLCGQLALYLTSKELGSYVTGIEKSSKYREGDLVAASIRAKESKGEGELWMCIMAFGKPERKLRQIGKHIDKFVFDKKCVYKTEISTNIQTILNSAVYAPSKMRMRPYRFVIYDNRVHVFVKNEAMMTSYQRVTFYLDCGIMLSYLGLKAEEIWMSMMITQMSKLKEREQKNYQYITTLLFEDQ